MEAPRCIVITGATGFTGPVVVRELHRRFPDAALRCFVRPASDRRVLTGLPVEFREGDLYDSNSFTAALSGADTLVNVASLGFGWVEPMFLAVRGSTTLRRAIFVSTTAILTRLPVKSRPLRERGEQMARVSGPAWTIVRPTMIYGGAGDRNISRLIRFVTRSPVVPVIAPKALQQPVHVEDVASAIATCLAAPRTVGKVYNLSGREPLTFESLVRQTIAATGARCAVVRVPFRPVLAGVRFYNGVVSRPRITVEQVLRLQEDKAFDHAPAREDFGFSPRSFADGVRDEVLALERSPTATP